MIVDHTDPEPIENFAQRVFTTWKPGRKGADDGLLLVLAPNNKQRKTRLQVGYGLEGALPDATARRILGEQVRPALDQGGAAAAATAAATIQKTLTAAGVTPDHSGRKQAEVPAVEIKLFALAFIYFIPDVHRGRRVQQTTEAHDCGCDQRPAGGGGSSGLRVGGRATPGAHGRRRVAARVAGAGDLVLQISTAGRGAAACRDRAARCRTDWKPRVPYVWAVWLAAAAVIALYWFRAEHIAVGIACGFF